MGCRATCRWEDVRVIVRCRLHLVIGLCCVIPTLSGCSDRFLAGPLQYVENEALTKDLKDKTNLAGKPRLQDKVRKGLAKLYGENPQKITVPEGWAFCSRAAVPGWPNYQQVGESIKRNVNADGKQIAGGYGALPPELPALPRRLGGRRRADVAVPLSARRATTAGACSSSPPRPTAHRPHRDDLSRTITNGLHGTSMPAFESLLTEDEIEQVVDYVIFLSMRGETELELIDEGAISDENDANALSMDEVVKDVAERRLQQVEDGPDPGREPADPPHPAHPREHPPRPGPVPGQGQGASWTAPTATACWPWATARASCRQDVFNHVVFGGNPSERPQRIDAARRQDQGPLGPEAGRLGQSAPPGQPEPRRLQGRPAADRHLLADRQGDHRRPDAGALSRPINEKQIWDLVNFVLALPTSPSCSKDAPPAAAAAGPRPSRWPTA